MTDTNLDTNIDTDTNSAATKTVLVERDGDVAIVRFNRPDKLNAFDAAMRRDSLAAVTEVNADDSIRVAVLTGAGRAFSAGADLTELQPADASVERMLNEEYAPVLMAITDAPKPWVSAVNGAAAGIGSAFAMNCDLTVMAEDAYIYQAFAAIGLIPDGGATWHLARTLGRKRAYELIALGEKVPARRCLELGLCNRVVPADELLDAALALARELATKAPLSLRYAKRAVTAAMTESVDQTMRHEAALQGKCSASEDAREGALAFLQKRRPEFRGR